MSDNNNFLEARTFFTNKIKFHYEEVIQVYEYLNVLHDLIRRIYESEPDSALRRAKLDFFRRCREDRQHSGLTALQKVIEYQNLLLDLYESNFVLGRRYYFF